MNTVTLETDAMNAALQEVLCKSVEVKQASAKPPHFESSTFRKAMYASDVPPSDSLSYIGDFFRYFGDVKAALGNCQHD